MSLHFLSGVVLLQCLHSIGGSLLQRVSLASLQTDAKDDGRQFTDNVNLSFASGVVRKCTVEQGLFAGRGDSLSLTADRGGWSHDDTNDATSGWCSFLQDTGSSEVVSNQSYAVSASFFNVKGNPPGIGHLGFAFNVIDKCAFDFVYWRMVYPAGCWQSGSMRGCKWTTGPQVTMGTCPDGLPSNAQWFDVKIEVASDGVTGYKKAAGAGAWTKQFNLKSNTLFNNVLEMRTGLLVANGYANQGYFNNWMLHFDRPTTTAAASACCNGSMSEEVSSELSALHGEIATLHAESQETKARIDHLEEEVFELKVGASGDHSGEMGEMGKMEALKVHF